MSEVRHITLLHGPYLALRCGHLWALPKVWPEAEIRGNVAGREWPATCGTGGLQHPKGVYELFSYSLSSLCHWANYVHTLEGAKEGVPTCPA